MSTISENTGTDETYSVCSIYRGWWPSPMIAGRQYEAGAPSFAYCANGGTTEGASDPHMASAASCPPLSNFKGGSPACICLFA
jgi:hypothetical protein